jgi:hypothetical protein
MSQGTEELKEEIRMLKDRVEELEREQVMYRPTPSEWMFNCKAPKCGCEGDPRWHADKAAQLASNMLATAVGQGSTRPPPVRKTSRGTGCPHKPQYRNCWCG